ncbi:MAG: sigma-54-dependent Fis family transcriptional regulator [Gemmatimonadetes bacterium]|nr:sigma-54-dependent Fis family transcriptional regulator [Gemmatimonadota bacterium]
MATILCVDDEPSVGMILEDALVRAGHEAVVVRGVPEALEVLARGGVDLIISDYRMPGQTGLEFLSILARDGYDVPLIMLTGHASIEHAVASIKAGAIDYITKPIRAQQLELAIDMALDFVRLRRENASLRRELMEYRSERQIVGDSAPIRRILQTVAMAAPTRASVLLQGESGTGKELFARAVHDQSDRRDGPFIMLNCAALPEGLIESVLFGHEKGAFTGALKRVEGAFERAHRGTLLLDEISEMRLDLQAKLLRVLQEREFERVGGTNPIRVDVRVIATTNRDLADEAAQGHFRQDLYFRLAVIPILIPPLRERKEDIPLLAMRFALKMGQELGKDITAIAPDAVAWLQAQDWPGNVRELQHAVERAVILSAEPIIPLRAFDAARFGIVASNAMQRPLDRAARTSGPQPVVTPGSMAPHPNGGNVSTHAPAPTYTPPMVAGNPSGTSGGAGMPNDVVLSTLNVADAERVLIQRALEVAHGNRTKAAEMLGISVRTLRNKLNQPGDEADDTTA